MAALASAIDATVCCVAYVVYSDCHASLLLIQLLQHKISLVGAAALVVSPSLLLQLAG